MMQVNSFLSPSDHRGYSSSPTFSSNMVESCSSRLQKRSATTSARLTCPAWSTYDPAVAREIEVDSDPR